jgi:hypothetical protein
MKKLTFAIINLKKSKFAKQADVNQEYKVPVESIASE